MSFRVLDLFAGVGGFHLAANPHPEPRCAYHQMGNAVAPPMASAIMEAMLAARA